MTNGFDYLLVSIEEGAATVYQKHKSLLIWEKMYRDWRLPGADELSGVVILQQN